MSIALLALLCCRMDLHLSVRNALRRPSDTYRLLYTFARQAVRCSCICHVVGFQEIHRFQLDLSCPEIGFGYEKCRIFALAEQKKMSQKSSIYTESTGGQLRIKFFPENFLEGKSLEGVEDCGGSHARRVGVISENSVTYRQRLGTLPLLVVW